MKVSLISIDEGPCKPYLSSLVIFILLSCVSCKKRAGIENEEQFSMNQIRTNYDSLIYYVTIKGDTNAYEELYYGFVDSSKSERTDSVLRYSKVMALNFNYERAYFDYLKALCEKYNVNDSSANLAELDLTNLDAASKEVVVDWLNQMLNDNVITRNEFSSVKK
jgi:hypothetical protein